MADNKTPTEQERDSTIFSDPRSAKSIRQEEKEERRRQRAALVKAARSGDPATKRVTRIMLIFLVAIVAVGAAVIFWQTRPDPDGIASDSAHYLDEYAQPEMSMEGIKSALAEAYYTTDGRLKLRLRLSNGLSTPQAVESFDLSLYNLNDDLIAVGHQPADWDPDTLRVPAEGCTDFIVFIPAGDVLIKNDSLYNLTITTEITGIPDDPSAIPTAE